MHKHKSFEWDSTSSLLQYRSNADVAPTQISFQPGDVAAPPGYLVDNGTEFREREHGGRNYVSAHVNATHSHLSV